MRELHVVRRLPRDNELSLVDTAERVYLCEPAAALLQRWCVRSRAQE